MKKLDCPSGRHSLLYSVCSTISHAERLLTRAYGYLGTRTRAENGKGPTHMSNQCQRKVECGRNPSCATCVAYGLFILCAVFPIVGWSLEENPQ